MHTHSSKMAKKLKKKKKCVLLVSDYLKFSAKPK